MVDRLDELVSRRIRITVEKPFQLEVATWNILDTLSIAVPNFDTYPIDKIQPFLPLSVRGKRTL